MLLHSLTSRSVPRVYRPLLSPIAFNNAGHSIGSLGLSWPSLLQKRAAITPAIAVHKNLVGKQLTFKRALFVDCRPKRGVISQKHFQQSFRQGVQRAYTRIYGPPKTPRAFVLLTVAGAVILLVVVLPFVLTFFFPLIIAGIVGFQLKRRKTSAMMAELHRSLQTSNRNIRHSTILGIQSKAFESIFQQEHFPNGMFGGVLNEFKSRRLDTAKTRREVEAMFSYVNSRVLDAFKVNESGVRDCFLGTDVSSWIDNSYDLEIKFDIPQTRGKIVEGVLVMNIEFPLLLRSSNQSSKQLATVAIAFQDRSLANENVASFEIFKDLARMDKECPMVLSIRPYRTLSSRLFILQDTGKGLFSVKKTNDGHREFTYNG
ncbi:LAME_0G05886g1_1 [Lachancea meyersii CBS 8951]|uniref:LAME_0G05886g1_1 n=1 Tax=Lachancea meyersii CBS 8951 TaxID=1266667 RepID=A0A1G4K7C1_9SACH|nr:LAME_0G05886g1_1 [Lachancea meyersii CBS 8951]